MASRRMLRSGDVRLETQPPSTARGLRTPRHNFIGEGLPEGALIAMTCAPVLAGDTVKNLSLNARIVGNLVDGNAKAAVLGKWFESWCFYVRIGDMAPAAAIRDMLVGGTPVSVNFTDECMKAIWTGYFTDEKEALAWNPAGANFLRYPGTGWWDSATNEALLPAEDPGGDEWKTQWARFEAMRRARLTTQTFEEYLAMQGVLVPPQLRVEHDPEMKMPELLHYSREFAYPAPAGFSADGTTERFRVQWFKQDKLERGRFCAEPGFVVTCCAVRPKIYRDTLFDPLELLEDGAGWLPAEFDTDPHTSLVEVAGTVFGDTVPGAVAVVDTRDLFLFGSQTYNGTATGFQPMDYSQRYRATGFATYNIDVSVSHAISSRVSKDTTS